MFPAVGWNLPRHVPPEGLTIAGRRFKAGVSTLKIPVSHVSNAPPNLKSS